MMNSLPRFFCGPLFYMPLGLIALLLGLAGAASTYAGAEDDLLQPVLTEQSVPGYLARIELNNPAEVEAILLRAEGLYLADGIPENLPPVVFVLHGPEVAIFQKQNYQQYKPIVDLAARLSAFQVIDIRICQTRLRNIGGVEAGLYPFVGSVPYGPAEVARLLDEEYVYF